MKKWLPRGHKAHGPPPSPGLVFNESSHRWTRPESGGVSDEESSDSEIESMADNAIEEWVNGSGGSLTKITSEDIKSGDLPKDVKRVYDRTQKEFENRGISNKDLIRGLAMNADAVLKIAKSRSADLSKTASYTEEPSTAADFAKLSIGMKKPYVVLIQITNAPVSSILASHDTNDLFHSVAKEENFDNETDNIAAIGGVSVDSVFVDDEEINLDEFIEDFSDGSISKNSEIIFSCSTKEVSKV